MDLEESIRSALEQEGDGESLPPGSFPAVLRRARVRRIVTSSLVSLSVAALVIGGAAGVRSLEGTPRRPGPGTGSTPTSNPSISVPSPSPPSPLGPVAVVPDLVGLSEGEAVKSLAEVGLIAEIRYQPEAPRTGQVQGSDPRAGSKVSPGSIVRLGVAYERALPIPDPSQEQESAPLGQLVETNPEAFVGLYRDHSEGTLGTLVVVFNPGIDEDEWRARLDAAAGELPYRTERCGRTRIELRVIQDELAEGSWTPNAASISFGVFVDPSTCTVRLDSDQLKPEDIQAISELFGTAVSLNTSEGASGDLLMPS